MKRLIPLPLILILAITAAGCHHSIERHVEREEIVERQNDVVLEAVLNDSSVVSYDRNGARYQWMLVGADTLLHVTGVTEMGDIRTVPVAEISTALLRTKQDNVAGSILAGIGVASAGVLTMFAIIVSGGME